jgi:hypothetical protein
MKLKLKTIIHKKSRFIGRKVCARRIGIHINQTVGDTYVFHSTRISVALALRLIFEYLNPSDD